MNTRLATLFAVTATALLACGGGGDEAPVGSPPMEDQPQLSNDTPLPPGSIPGDEPSDDPVSSPDVGSEIALSPFEANTPFQGSSLNLASCPT